jgi:tetratricopeptide (TPR) repeat protein
MRGISALLLMAIALSCSAAYGQNSNPQTPNTPPTPGDSSSKQAEPPSPPATPDSSTPPASDKKEPAVKRKLKELAPGCVNVGAYHKCRSSRQTTPPQTAKDAGPDTEFAKDMDVGDFYLNQKKNYAGAAMRFRDALEQKPNDPRATFMLAQSLEGLQQNDEARETYAAYLKLEPKGPFAGDAKKALERLQTESATQDGGKGKQVTVPKDSHL